MSKDKRPKTNDKRQFRVLFVGDIVAHVGRNALLAVLPTLKKEKKIDFVIANGENSTTGNGMTRATMEEMIAGGVDFFTTGNHIWKKPEFFDDLSKPATPVVRPANYPEGSPGVGYKIVKTSFGKFLIASLLGREGINANVESPFKVADTILEENEGKYDYSLFDFHAEMTSEKVAMGHYLDGKVNIVVGTHTHVPTADAQILSGGTAFVSDVGMVGPKNSVLGVRTDIILDLFTTGMPQKFEIAEGPCFFNSVMVDFVDGKAHTIVRVDKDVDI